MGNVWHHCEDTVYRDTGSAHMHVLTVQEQNRPDINIVCEKIAFQGLTRFEDRQALPLGVSTNFTAYSAKLLTQVSSMKLMPGLCGCTPLNSPSQVVASGQRSGMKLQMPSSNSTLYWAAYDDGHAGFVTHV